MSPVRLLAALVAIVVGLVIVLFTIDSGGDDEDTLAIDGAAAATPSDAATDAADTDDPVDLPVTGPAAGSDEPGDVVAQDDGEGDEATTTVVAADTAPPTAPSTTTPTTAPPTTIAATTTTLPALEPTDVFPCSFASRQAMLTRLSDIEDLETFSDADLYLRTVARSILEVGQVLTEEERVLDLENSFDAFRSFPDGCPDVIDQAFDDGDRFLCRASQISVDERIHDYLERAVGAQMDGCGYPVIDR